MKEVVGPQILGTLRAPGWAETSPHHGRRRKGQQWALCLLRAVPACSVDGEEAGLVSVLTLGPRSSAPHPTPGLPGE